MPNIVEYNSQSDISPSDKGISGAAQAGQYKGQVLRQIGQDIKGVTDAVERHMAVMETSELYKTGTELRLGLQTRYEKESALPENRNDPHFGDRFMAEVAPLLEKWGSGAGTEHGKQLAATLKSSIRNDLFNHVASGQAAMDTAHVLENSDQTHAMLKAGMALDPSVANLERTIGTQRDAVQGMTMAIPDVETRERIAAQLTAQYLPDIVESRYKSVAESIRNQIEESGDPALSPAYKQMGQDIANQVGFQYMKADPADLETLRDSAKQQGMERYRARVATNKAEIVDKGNAAYAQIDAAYTALAASGGSPTPELIAATDHFSQLYGATNPAHAHALNEARLRFQKNAQDMDIQAYDPKAWAEFQSRIDLPAGDPRRVTQPQLLEAWSNQRITIEQLKLGTELLNKRDQPASDPTFNHAWENFKRWQGLIVQGIGTTGQLGLIQARAAFIHDSTANFMARGKVTGDWNKTLETMTNAQDPTSYAGPILTYYKQAAGKINPAEWLKERMQWDPNSGAVLRAYPVGGPRTPGQPNPAPSAPVAAPPASSPAADLKKADDIIWGKP